MRTLRFRPSVEPFPASTGDIYLLRSDGGHDLVLREATPFARELVELLSAGVAVGDGPDRARRVGGVEEAGVGAGARATAPRRGWPPASSSGMTGSSTTS